MPTHEILIAACDEPEAHRKKEGDVICVRPHPWNWGRKEVDRYLIVIVDDPRPSEELGRFVRNADGTQYRLTSRIVTTSGRRDDRTILIIVKEL